MADILDEPVDVDAEDIISISDDDEHDATASISREKLLEPIVQRVVDALGGPEPPSNKYRLGDSASACLSDLKKLWRRDDIDDERTVARLLFRTRVLPNDLIPILLTLPVDDPRALKCADVICAMTWPIDIAEELKEMDEEKDDEGTPDYTELILAHRMYKAALLTPGALEALFGIALVPIAKAPRERTPKDAQIVGVILYIVRNLFFITDPQASAHSSADKAGLSGLQDRLVRAISEMGMFDLLLTIAAGGGEEADRVERAFFDGFNTVILEIFYLLLRGVKPEKLVIEPAKQSTDTLHRLLAAENKARANIARAAPSRHSRFGTTIAVTLKSSSTQSLVLHKQAALKAESGSILDLNKKGKGGSKSKGRDELGREDNLGLEARKALQATAVDFIRACFNLFLAGLLKDIRSERPKITEKDHLRLLFVTRWFLEFFLAAHRRQGDEATAQLRLGMVAEVTERGWVVWVLKRMRGAIEDKPKQWTEMQAGIQALTALFLLLSRLHETSASAYVETAQVLEHQLIYNGEVLDIALDSLKAYKEGTQSFAYLEASVSLGWTVLKGVERAASRSGDSTGVLVRKKKKQRRKRQDDANDEAPDEERDKEEEEDRVLETLFTLDSFEMKLANSEITRTLLAYLSHYRDFDSPDEMGTVVSLLHRQAVRAKAEGLFFNASTLDLFSSILADQRSLPKEQPYKDLINLINFILRKFFKALAEEPFLAVEAFFPKNRSQWKAFSSYDPKEKGAPGKDTVEEDTRFPQEVQVKRGHSWSEQVAIVVAALDEAGKRELVNWVCDLLSLVIGMRQRIIDETDVKGDDGDDIVRDDDDAVQNLPGPSVDALSKLTDYLIPYISDEQADAATRNSELKLLFRLVKFHILDENAEELEWYIPAAIVPRELQMSLNVIKQFLETPIDLEGKKAAQLLSKKARGRRRRRRSPSPQSDREDDEPLKKRKDKKKKEKEIYKSAPFIEDSDDEYGGMEAFLEKERSLRDRMALAAAETGKLAPMKAAGTKKRRKRDQAPKGERGRKKRKSVSATEKEEQAKLAASSKASYSSSEDSDLDPFGSPKKPTANPSIAEAPRPKPRPRPRLRKPTSESSSPGDRLSPSVNESNGEENAEMTSQRKKKGRLILSDEE